MANPFKSLFRSALENFSSVLAQIHQDLEELWPFLECPELCTLKSQIDLIAQLLLSLIKETSRRHQFAPGIP